LLSRFNAVFMALIMSRASSAALVWTRKFSTGMFSAVRLEAERLLFTALAVYG